ncbi:MAG: S41 family peptidase [Bacteroidota bacterium]
MKNTLFLFLFLCLLSWSSSGQDCDCQSSFKWVKQTFEDNDAGFTYALQEKGEKAYAAHNASTSARVATISTSEACTQALLDWLRFFRSGHVGIQQLNNNRTTTNAPTETEEDIKKKFVDWERRPLQEAEFKRYLDGLEEPGYEGIWVSEPYRIAIRKEGNNYVGSMLNQANAYWAPDQVKMKISAKGNKIVTTYYMRDHSPEVFSEAELIGNNYLQAGFIGMQRVYPVIKETPAAERFIRSMETDKPFFEQLSPTTALLRIPTFSGSEKQVIDSVIQHHREQILATENLIIDIRNNGGGSDRCYNALLPIMYTNPIRSVGVEYYSTPLNNQRMLDFINKPEYNFDESGKQWAQESYDVLSTRIGEFVNLKDEIVSITTYDTIYPFPKNVGILINGNNGSTSEQFLLAAKQSKKVKLFGTTTFGVLDISNMYYVDAPCGDFQLGYSLTRSMRIPDMTIDDKGIKPDYYLDKSIPSHSWIDFTQEVLSSQ